MCNVTEDTPLVPMRHVQFEPVESEEPSRSRGRPASPAATIHCAGESGAKDTLIAYPGEITRVRTRVGQPEVSTRCNCHSLEHPGQRESAAVPRRAHPTGGSHT